ncbi:MAG: DUF1427 family protein [Pseudomonadota bacterium]
MTLNPYLVSLAVGLGIGIVYGLLAVRSPAPPIIALIGLLGMLAGETAVQWLRGHPSVLSHLLHEKSFSVAKPEQKQASPQHS